MTKTLHRVRVTAIVTFDVENHTSDLPELVNFTENLMWVRLQQGHVTAKSITTEVIE